MTDLTQRTAFVTGGGRGIGRGIVLGLAEAGADVAIADVDLDSAEQTAKEVSSLGRRALVLRVDVTDTRSVQAAVDRAIEEFGKLGAPATRDPWFQAFYDDVWAQASLGGAAAGSCFWILYADAYPDYDGFGVYAPAHATTMAIVRAQAARMAGL